MAGITRVTQVQGELDSQQQPGAPGAAGTGTQAQAGQSQLGGPGQQGGVGTVAAPGFFAPGGTKGPGDEEAREGGKLSIDEVEEGVEEGRVVRSFEIKGDQVRWEGARGEGGCRVRPLKRVFFVPASPALCIDQVRGEGGKGGGMNGSGVIQGRGQWSLAFFAAYGLLLSWPAPQRAAAQTPCRPCS